MAHFSHCILAPTRLFPGTKQTFLQPATAVQGNTVDFRANIFVPDWVLTLKRNTAGGIRVYSIRVIYLLVQTDYRHAWLEVYVVSLCHTPLPAYLLHTAKQRMKLCKDLYATRRVGPPTSDGFPQCLRGLENLEVLHSRKVMMWPFSHKRQLWRDYSPHVYHTLPCTLPALLSSMGNLQAG